MIKLGLVQAASCSDREENLRFIDHYTKQAAQMGCRVICFGECFLTGYLPEQAQTLALSADAPILKRLGAMAQDYRIDILAGFMERWGEDFFITHGLFRKDGSFDSYRKTHLGQRERQFFTPGDTLNVLSLSDGLKIGLQLCVETHYPDITRTLALRGAEVVFAPHAVPRVSGDRQTIWNKYIPARSYDNRVYMACCNLWDSSYFGGGCMVTGPRGEVCAACFEDGPALLTCRIDPQLIASFRDPGSKRSRHFFPATCRKELYE